MNPSKKDPLVSSSMPERDLNFARDFGERFVPGSKRPSTVDLLVGSPFSE
jgi:hypothetical protein